MNTQGMINKLNHQYEERLLNTIEMVKVDIKDLVLNKKYVLNNGYRIMHCNFIGCKNDGIELYEFQYGKRITNIITLNLESTVKYLYEIKVIK